MANTTRSDSKPDHAQDRLVFTLVLMIIVASLVGAFALRTPREASLDTFAVEKANLEP